MPKRKRDEQQESKIIKNECLSYPILYIDEFRNLKSSPFEGLFLKIRLNHHWIPTTWPKLTLQRGFCCGLYALEGALRFAYPKRVEIPPARKEGNKDIVSLRQVAKAKNWSAFGEIYDVDVFQKLTNHFGFDDCLSVTVNLNKKELYTKTIKKHLRLGYVVIVSCDKSDLNMPGNRQGERAHWALVFGYLYIGRECYFLVTQYAKYYLWEANQLEASNRQLPVINPKVYPHYAYFKDPVTKVEFFNKITNIDEVKRLQQSGNKIMDVIDKNLTAFRGTLFAVPAPAMQSKINVAASIKSKKQ